MSESYTALLPVFAVSAATPVLVGLMPPRFRLPQVVLLLAGGVIIGPQALGWSSPADVKLLSDLGLGFLFLLAGYELDPRIMREPTGRRATWSWLTSLAISVAFVATLAATGLVHSVATVAIALTTTALGVLLPVMRENGLLDSPLGKQVFASGAAGELGPIVAMALFLGTRHTGPELVLLILFAVAAIGLAYVPGRVRLPRTTEVLLRSEHGTGQSTLRLTLALLVALLAVTADLGFDSVLGAFVAGMVLRHWAPGDVDKLEDKLDIVGWGVFIPVFFVSSGMALDIHSIAQRPLLLIVVLVLLLLVRGGPTLLWYRRALPVRERLQLSLFSATALPLIVALTGLAVADGSMGTDAAAALVGAGAVSVLIFPLLAVTIGRKGAERRT